MRAPVDGTDGLKKARKEQLALATQGSGLTAGFREMEEARRALHRIYEHADIGAKLARSLGGMYRLDEASQAMRGIGAQVAGQSAKWQEAVDNLTTSLNSLRSGMVPDTSLLGTAAYSQVLHDLVNRNQALSSQVDNSIADITADLNESPIKNPIHETNEKLDQLLTMQVDLARLHQSLNETTIAFLSDFRNVAQKTSRQTRIFMGLGFLTLIAAIVGTWLNFATSNDLSSANQRMLESLADRIATIQSNMASQSADEREAILAEQRSLIEQFINTSQALMEQQRIEQRAAIQEFKDALNRTEALSKEPTQTPR